MHERATVGAAVSAAWNQARSGGVDEARAKMASAPIAAKNKLSHRLSTSQPFTSSTSSLVSLQRFTPPEV